MLREGKLPAGLSGTNSNETHRQPLIKLDLEPLQLAKGEYLHVWEKLGP